MIDLQLLGVIGLSRDPVECNSFGFLLTNIAGVKRRRFVSFVNAGHWFPHPFSG